MTVTIEAAPVVDTAPIAVDDEETVDHGKSMELTVLDNDTDDNLVDVTSVAIVDEAHYGTVAVDETTGNITYTHDGGIELTDSFSYTVEDDADQISGVATVNVTVLEPLLPLAGLVLHLEADSGVTANGGKVNGWAGLTANSLDLAIAVNSDAPSFIADSLNSLPVVEFDGVDDQLIGDISSSLPLSNENRTVVLLLNTNGGTAVQYGDYVPDGAISLGADSVSGNAVFDFVGPGNTHVSSLGLSVQGWQIQSAVINNGQWDHYLNDVIVDSGSGSFATGSTSLSIGGDLQGGNLAGASIAALLIYDASLSALEYQEVLDYLRVKYALSF